MSSSTNLGQSRDQLMQQMLSLSTESNFYSMLEETLKEILECRTLSPYLYLHKKMSLKSKFDNSKTSQYTCQLAIYLSSVSPLILPKQTITNKLMSLCIDKFNHLKIKKFQTNQFMSFLLIDLVEKQKSQFTKYMNEQKMDNENIPVMMFANIMYWTLVYLWSVREVTELAGKLKNLGVGGGGNNSSGENIVSCEVFNEYLDKVDEENSLLKMLELGDLTEGENILEKIMSRIFLLFEGTQNNDANKN